ncbi:MAG TPA: DUF5675 family protein [Marinilabiliaceae bacterium]|nr:DUF5675 family protein [Marinilabiliaceae bacterium]
MDLYLHRTHYKNGTNGILFHKRLFMCFCIELPWIVNKRNISCIPDGTYEMESFYSPKFGHHLRIKNVPERLGILMHPANDALKELRGCIAPVSQLTGIGKGLGSRQALEKVMLRVEGVLEPGEVLFLTIRSEHSGR